MPTPPADSKDANRIRVTHGSDADLAEHKRQTEQLLRPRKRVPTPTADELVDAVLNIPPTLPAAEVDTNAAMLLDLQQAEASGAFANANHATPLYDNLRTNRERQTQQSLQWKRGQPLLVDEASRVILAVSASRSSDASV